MNVYLLLKAMLREEYRLHTSLFSRWLFMFFPILLALIAFLLTLASAKVVGEGLQVALHIMIIFYAMSVGAFGLLGKEALRRRFGEISFIPYCFSTLPLSLREIFTAFFIKDAIFYMGLMILPITLGNLAASLLLETGVLHSLLLLLSLALCFAYGLSLSMLIATLYEKIGKGFIAILAVVVFALLAFKSHWVNMGFLLYVILPYKFFVQPSSSLLLATLGISALFAGISILFLQVEQPRQEQVFKSRLNAIASKLNMNSSSAFVAKDLIDMQRSPGGFGKLVFSFIFPMFLILLLLWVFEQIFGVNFGSLLLFAVILGALSTTIYNWLSEFDTPEFYLFLPVTTRQLLKSKFISFFLISWLPSSLFLLLIAALLQQMDRLFPSLVMMLCVSVYVVSLLVYLAGLKPNIMLYNSEVFLHYALAAVPPMLVLFVLSAFYGAYQQYVLPMILIFSLLLVPVAMMIIKRSYAKWEKAYFR